MVGAARYLRCGPVCVPGTLARGNVRQRQSWAAGAKEWLTVAARSLTETLAFVAAKSP